MYRNIFETIHNKVSLGFRTYINRFKLGLAVVDGVNTLPPIYDEGSLSRDRGVG